MLKVVVCIALAQNVLGVGTIHIIQIVFEGLMISKTPTIQR